VFLDDAGVLHGHLPAGEGYEPGAEFSVEVVERRASERFRHDAKVLRFAGSSNKKARHEAGL
jgi:hypothetical protein